jgi:uncharacterized protein (DUF1330 family)
MALAIASLIFFGSILAGVYMLASIALEDHKRARHYRDVIAPAFEAQARARRAARNGGAI